MLVEYRCICGFKTILPLKYFRHSQTCEVFKQEEKRGALSRSRKSGTRVDAE